MDRDGDAAPVSPASFPEQEMDRESFEREVFPCADAADGAGISGIAVYIGLHSERHSSFKICICLFKMERGGCVRQDAPHGLRVLGIRVDVPAPGSALGDGHGDGGKRIQPQG